MQVRNASPIEQPPVSIRLSIIIVTYNSAAVLPGLFNSLPNGLAEIREI